MLHRLHEAGEVERRNLLPGFRDALPRGFLDLPRPQPFRPVPRGAPEHLDEVRVVLGFLRQHVRHAFGHRQARRPRRLGQHRYCRAALQASNASPPESTLVVGAHPANPGRGVRVACRDEQEGAPRALGCLHRVQKGGPHWPVSPHESRPPARRGGDACPVQAAKSSRMSRPGCPGSLAIPNGPLFAPVTRAPVRPAYSGSWRTRAVRSSSSERGRSLTRRWRVQAASAILSSSAVLPFPRVRGAADPGTAAVPRQAGPAVGRRGPVPPRVPRPVASSPVRKGSASHVGAAQRHRRWFRAPARCRPEVGVPSRPRASSRSALRSFAALLCSGAGLKAPTGRTGQRSRG